MLKFFGDGGALDINRGSTSAFYIDDKTLILIDTGYGVYEKILNLHLLDKVEKVEILITHTHGDHVSSLASICDYLKFYNIMVRRVDYKIYYENSENLIKLLKLMLIDWADKIVLKPSQCKYVLQCLPQEHFENAYGYILNIAWKTIFYSGDAKHINETALSLLKQKKIDYFYQEVTLIENIQHTNIKELIDNIPSDLRSRVYCMHLNDETASEVEKTGFRLVDIAF